MAIRVAGDICISTNGRIHANYQGFDSLHGPGCPSSSGGGSYGGQGDGGKNCYGSVTNPMCLGSGGRGWASTTVCGGGALKLTVAGTLKVNGSIQALGRNNGYYVNPGSGGSIWIDCDTLAGSGYIKADGGSSPSFSGRGGAGGGRIAVHCQTNEMDVSHMTAYGGTRYGVYFVHGSAGTIYIEDRARDALIVKNADRDASRWAAQLLDGPYQFDEITLADKGYLSIENGVTLDISASSAVVTGDGTGCLVAKLGSTMRIPSGIWEIAGFAFCPVGNADYSATITYDPAPSNVVIKAGGSLRSLANETVETYKLFFACTNLTIESGGLVSVSSKGFCSLYGPGCPSSEGGASYGGQGHGKKACYGSVTQPTHLGSGGRGWANPMVCGGGAMKLVVSRNLTVDGSIDAIGSNNGYYVQPGSGGSVWIECGRLVGTGTIRANGGGAPSYSGQGGAGGGRIAVYCRTNEMDDTHMTAIGGARYSDAFSYGSAGTVYVEDDAGSTLVMQNADRDAGRLAAQLRDGPYQFDAMVFRDKAVLSVEDGVTLDISDSSSVASGDGTGSLVAKLGATMRIPSGTWEIAGFAFCPVGNVDYSSTVTYDPAPGNVVIKTGGSLRSLANETAETYKLFFACSNLTVESNGLISVSYKGFCSNYGPGCPDPAGGGSYGGVGDGNKACYGSVTQPIHLGSGGRGWASSTVCGGGAMKLVVSGTLTVDGSIDAIGSNNGYYVNPGSGGSIWIDCGTLAGTGYIRANGGSSSSFSGRGGAGGGRIAVFCPTNHVDVSHVIAYGGGRYSTSCAYGGAGTVFYKHPAQARGDLFVNNNVNGLQTQLPTGSFVGVPPTLTFDSITVTNRGKLELPADLTLAVNQDVTLVGNGAFSAGKDSAVVLTSTNEALLTGNMTFCNFVSTNAGKVIKFEEASTQTVTGYLHFSGVTLNSTVDELYWYLDLEPGATQSVDDVRVRDSYASGETIVARVANSKCHEHTVNWLFTYYAGSLFLIR